MADEPEGRAPVEDRATAGQRGSEAAKRGTGYRREGSLPKTSGIYELPVAEPPYRVIGFHVVGFAIGKADLTDAMTTALDSIILYIKKRGDVNYHVIVTGTASESKIQLLDPVRLGRERAEAVAKYLIEHDIPGAAVFTFSHGSIGAPAATSAPELKAPWRGAFIDIRFSGISLRKAPQQYIPPLVADPAKDTSNIKLLLPPTKSPFTIKGAKEFKKKLEDLGHFFVQLNQSASGLVLRNAFNQGWAKAMAHLTDADPKNRSLEQFQQLLKLPRYTVKDLEQFGRLHAKANPVVASQLVDFYRSAGTRLAFDQIQALGPEEYEKYASRVVARFPELNMRFNAYLELAARGQFHLI